MAEKNCRDYQSENPCQDNGCSWDDEKKTCQKGGGSVFPFLFLMALAGAILLIKTKSCQPFLRFNFQVPKSGKVTISGPGGFFFQSEQSFGVVTIPLPAVGKYSYKIESDGYETKGGKVAVGCEGYTINIQLVPAQP